MTGKAKADSADNGRFPGREFLWARFGRMAREVAHDVPAAIRSDDHIETRAGVKFYIFVSPDRENDVSGVELRVSRLHEVLQTNPYHSRMSMFLASTL